MSSFHSRTGSLVTLSNSNKSAQRNRPSQEFNNGVVLSANPLRDNQLFEVRIDKKVNSWSGSVEIGVTTSDPSTLNFPTSATGFREGTWIMSGSTVMRDGCTILEEYGQDLDHLGEGDRVGVLRTSNGSLHFYVNGVDQGAAVNNVVPETVFAVIDMYGKCAQVTVLDDTNRGQAISNELTNEAIAEASVGADLLTFHERCGSLVKLLNNRRSAERMRPLDEFNNGVVMTSRPLRNNEIMEIRLDRLVDKWSGSIEVGITTHNPSSLEFPATMTNMRSGIQLPDPNLVAELPSTSPAENIIRLEFPAPSRSQHCTIMMSGCGILTNGKGTRREYGEFNLDELQEGDIIGMQRKSSGVLHYYINGIDQGVAATSTPATVWAVVDLYGMAVKVTLLDRSDREENTMQRLGDRVNNSLRLMRDIEDDEGEDSSIIAEMECDERLRFHSKCGSHAAVINSSRTAHRPNALDDFNNGVVLTSRMLRPGEMFEVRLDQMVDKWAGSIEIGVTTHSPTDLDYPSTMTNIRSGTWMMTGNGVMHNGTTVIDDYGQNLDRLKVGDRVGAMRNEDGTLHFTVNGIDQGPAGTNIPGAVYGVIDLYGQASQASIVEHLTDGVPEVAISVASSDLDELRFHHLHGHNVVISPDGRTASRPNAVGEFNDSIVMSNRPLKDDEMFEVVIDKMVERWSGSIEAGLTLIKPENLDFPNTMTDIDHDTWMLSGSAIMLDGCNIRNGYHLDLDNIVVGSRIGMMRTSGGELHYFFNGIDQGVACGDIPPGVHAVIDLYGQCAQVSLTSGSVIHQPPDNSHLTAAVTPSVELEQSLSSPFTAEMMHRLSQCAGRNVTIKNNGYSACRVQHFDHGLIFSADPIRPDELFEVRVEQVSEKWTGSLQIGLTSMAISDTTPFSLLPANANQLKSKVTWLMSGSDVYKCGTVIKENYAPSLERLQVGDRVGVKRAADGTMHIYIGLQDMGIAATNIPKNVFAIIDLYGSVEAVAVSSSVSVDVFNGSLPTSLQITEPNSEVDEAEHDEDTSGPCPFSLVHHGKNIVVSNQGLTAQRTASYNQGLVISANPLTKNQLFKVRIEQMNPRWSSSLMIGVMASSLDKACLPVSALNMKKLTWVIYGDSVFQSGVKVKDRYGPNLDSLQQGHTVGVMVDTDNCLHLYVNDMDQGIAARDIPQSCHIMVDLYGQCERVTVVMGQMDAMATTPVQEYREKADMEEGMKEKPRHTESLVKNCEYRNMCNRFLATLGLPDGFFNCDNNRCYCETCHKIRGDEPYFCKGEPPKPYALPFGWCIFGLRVSQRVDIQHVFEKWHMAYHGTQAATVRRILDTGDLNMSKLHSVKGTSIFSTLTHFEEKNKPEEETDIQPIFLSPTIKYAGSPLHSPRQEFKDPKTKKSHFAQVALQICVKPGSYKIGPQSIGANEQIDPKFSNTEVEWSTKERGGIVLYALMVKVD